MSGAPKRCPTCGEPVYVSHAWREWACSDPECVRAHGDGPGGGFRYEEAPQVLVSEKDADGKDLVEMRAAARAVGARLYSAPGKTAYVTCPDFPAPCAEYPAECRQSVALDAYYRARRPTELRLGSDGIE